MAPTVLKVKSIESVKWFEWDWNRQTKKNNNKGPRDIWSLNLDTDITYYKCLISESSDFKREVVSIKSVKGFKRHRNRHVKKQNQRTLIFEVWI